MSHKFLFKRVRAVNETKTERGLQVAANLTTILSALRGLTYLVILLGLPYAACSAGPMLDRVVVVLERMDLDRAIVVMERLERKVDRMFEAAAPIGREAVAKGLKTLKEVDAKTLGQALTEAAKRKLKGMK